MTTWNRAASRGRTNLPHCQPKNCARCSRTTVRSRAPRRTSRRRMPMSRNARPTLPSATRRAAPSWPRVSTSTPGGAEDQRGDAHDRQREQAAEREPEEHVARMTGEVLARPALLDRAGGEEEHLVGGHGGAEQRDRVVEVRGAAFAPAHGGCGGLVDQRSPQSGPELPERDGEHDEAQAERGRRRSPCGRNRTRQITIQTAKPTSGIQSR